MKVLFGNPPWWAEKSQMLLATNAVADVYRMGVRAGSRWPFTLQTLLPPDCAGPEALGQLYLPYPFFLGYAATYAARETDAEVHFRDSIALHESYDRFYRYLEEHRFDIIVIDSASPSWGHDREQIRAIAARFPGTRFIVAGPIATSGEKILADCPEVIAVVKGEYEKGVVKVIKGARGVIDFDLLTVEEMNSSPFPYFDELHARRYYDSNPRGQIMPHAHVWSSRGCPFKCIFCVWPATMTGNDPDGNGKRKVRHYSADYMEAFLGELVQKYGFKSIYFDDDTFNLGDNHVEKMCKVMRKIGVPWSAMCRADSSRFDLWEEMRDSGCFGVKLGFESGNQWVVDNIVNKRLDLELARDVVMEIKRLGMTVHGTFTFGLPGETAEQMKDTERYIETLGLTSLQKSGCAEIEGTPLHTLVESKHLDKYDGATVDGNYVRATDGARKFEELARQAAAAGDGGETGAAMNAEFVKGTYAAALRLPDIDPKSVFQTLPQDVAGYERVSREVMGYSKCGHYSFFRALIDKFSVRSVLMLGVYMGRDIAFLLDIARSRNLSLRIVGVDKFSNDYCEDWPEDRRSLTWQDAGFGTPPSVELASQNLMKGGLGACSVHLVKGRDDDYLATCTEKFDLIYIDTSHDYQTVMRQIAACRNFLSPTGLLAGDDYSDDGTWGVKRAVCDSFDAHWLIDNWIWLAGPSAGSVAVQTIVERAKDPAPVTNG